MSSVVVKPVSSRKEQRQFINLPWTIYKNDPNWVPPLLMDRRRLLGYLHHPFHDHADMQTFLASRDGQVCGRVAAIISHLYNERSGERLGFFGFFEAIDDQGV